MRNLVPPLPGSRLRPVFVSVAALAFSLVGRLVAAPTPPVSLSALTGYLGSDYSHYSLKATGPSQSSNAWSFGGAGTLPLDAVSSLQFDADYFRLSPGSGLPGSNAWTSDLHYNYKLDDVPVGVFLGEFSNGPTTWGGGLESSLPLGKVDWLPSGASAGGDPLFNFQGFYGRTHSTKLNHWGGQCEMRLCPCEVSRISLNVGYQHTSSNSIPGFNFTDNIFSFGLGCEYQFPCGWELYGDYEHTHFNTSGLGVNGFTLGARYCFGHKPKIRDNEVPYSSFSQLLGVSAKF